MRQRRGTLLSQRKSEHKLRRSASYISTVGTYGAAIHLRLFEIGQYTLMKKKSNFILLYLERNSLTKVF